MLRKPQFLLTLLAAFALGSPSMVYAAPSEQVITSQAAAFNLEEVATGLSNLWGMTFLPDGSMVVTERAGKMRVISKDGVVGEPVKGLPAIAVGGQGGLLDVVASPQFNSNRKIYFSYSEPSANGKTNSTAVSEAILVGNQLVSVKTIFSQKPKVNSAGHFGSRLVFADDGTLFITLGDRQSEKDKAQTLDNHIGKVVRINVDGSVPKDNPYINQKGALPEIWSYGHRNIQGAAIHPETRVLWTGEHGPQGGDEINITQAGKNYGWPVITYGENYGGGKIGEGTHKEGMEQPLYKWVPSIATAGFIFYTGDAFPEWKGNILMTSLKDKTLVRLTLDGDKVVSEERLLGKELKERLRHVVQGPDGFVYLLTDEYKARVLRLRPVAQE
ncbi:MAG: PQQ-dependent sugar dehydrogenase [Cellvibrio sp.]